MIEIKTLEEYIEALREEARTHRIAMREQHRGEWCYAENDRHSMSVEARLLDRIAGELVKFALCDEGGKQ